MPAPRLVAAVCEIEEDGRRHHRNPAGGGRKSPFLLGQPCHGASRCIETEDRAAGEHNRVHGVDEAGDVERAGLARARSAAPHVGGGRDAFARDDGGDAGPDVVILRLTDENAINIGDEIERSGLHVPPSLAFS